MQIEQTTACGQIIEDVPVEGEIVFTTDDTYLVAKDKEAADYNMYHIGSTAYIRHTYTGLLEIERVRVLLMWVNIKNSQVPVIFQLPQSA